MQCWPKGHKRDAQWKQREDMASQFAMLTSSWRVGQLIQWMKFPMMSDELQSQHMIPLSPHFYPITQALLWRLLAATCFSLSPSGPLNCQFISQLVLLPTTNSFPSRLSEAALLLSVTVIYMTRRLSYLYISLLSVLVCLLLLLLLFFQSLSVLYSSPFSPCLSSTPLLSVLVCPLLLFYQSLSVLYSSPFSPCLSSTPLLSVLVCPLLLFYQSLSVLYSSPISPCLSSTPLLSVLVCPLLLSYQSLSVLYSSSISPCLSSTPLLSVLVCPLLLS